MSMSPALQRFTERGSVFRAADVQTLLQASEN